MNPFTRQSEALPSNMREKNVDDWLQGKGPTEIGKELNLDKQTVSSIVDNFGRKLVHVQLTLRVSVANEVSFPCTSFLRSLVLVGNGDSSLSKSTCMIYEKSFRSQREICRKHVVELFGCQQL